MAVGRLFIVSAPSGAGKSTVIRHLLEQDLVPAGSLELSVSHTTRLPRKGEQNGREYHFVDRADFQEMVRDDQFLEWAEVFGNLYGTSRRAVEPRLREGIDVLLEIDVEGARQVLERFPEACGVFLLPPSYQELERRLRHRALDSPQVIDRRLAVSSWEIRRYESYDYVIVNRDAAYAAQALAAAILEKRHRLSSQRDEVLEILRGFPAEECQSPQ
ncbi:MAG: guanylate kinase [Deltaproteobacteria bacterium]|nr:guanylate kinase [Deltaproteobacteria bacterium]